ncbi:MAG: class I SAM-dependent methyltransferase [Candidatus Saccharimonadales bacterium]
MTEQAKEAMNDKSYTKMTADVYDALYAKKNYESEATKIKGLVASHKKTDGKELLDVACGTGLHLPYLVDDFDITGVDLSEQQLAQARKRLPEISFNQGDMRNFDLGHQFDVVTCLFSSIGYVHPYEDMKEAVANMAKHLKPGGVLLVEPWLQPGVFDPTRPAHSEVGELPEKGLKVTRTAHNGIDGNVSVMNMHHVVESPEGIREFTEEHRLTLYTNEEYQQAFEAAGLSFELDEQGLSNRGLFIGGKPLAATVKP